MCDSSMVYAKDDDGVELNAEFAVHADGSHLSLTLESAGGRGRDGRPRNHQYVPALTLLLERLRDHHAVLLTALVASRQTAAMPEADRTVLSGPIEMAAVTDIERLRLDLTTPQGRIRLPSGATKEGNNRKRLWLWTSLAMDHSRPAAWLLIWLRHRSVCWMPGNCCNR